METNILEPGPAIERCLGSIAEERRGHWPGERIVVEEVLVLERAPPAIGGRPLASAASIRGELQ